MKILNDYFEARKAVCAYFGYVEKHGPYQFIDSTALYWQIRNTDGLAVWFSATADIPNARTREEEISSGCRCGGRFTSSVYRGKEYTMLITNAIGRGPIQLRIFDNAKEIKK